MRYADNIAFAIKEGANSEMVSQGFQQFFNEALTELKLEATSFEGGRGAFASRLKIEKEMDLRK